MLKAREYRYLSLATGLGGNIYEWLQGGRSSDTDNHGIACDSASNPDGYIPTVEPMGAESCPADAASWRGLRVCDEQPRNGYDRDAFESGYTSLEDDIIAALPPADRSIRRARASRSRSPPQGPPRRTSSTSPGRVLHVAAADSSRRVRGDLAVSSPRRGGTGCIPATVERRQDPAANSC